MNVWHWYQWVAAGYLALSIIAGICLHDKPRSEKWNGYAAIADVFLWLWILTVGGFWK